MPANSPLNFERYVHDANKYFKDLTQEIKPAEDINRVFIVWRAVMHTLRDRIHMGESLDLLSQLPMILKGLYVENWQYHEQSSLQYETLEEMVRQVEELQSKYGEDQFNWEISTEDIITVILSSLDPYISQGQWDHIKAQLPEGIHPIIESAHHPN